MGARVRFEALDGLRGIAALAVLLLHFGQASAPWVVPHAYLAVDFFFALSGFVIASAYDQKLRSGMSVVSFVKQRLIRLYPLIALGVLIGAASYVRVYEGTAMVVAIVTGLLLIPTPLAPPSETFNAMPINPPAWSLFAEVIGNVVFALIVPRLSDAVLAVLVVAFAALLGIASWHYGDLNIGSFWPNLWGGIPRFGFSFLTGVGLFRLWSAGRLSTYRAPGLLIVAALCAVFVCPLDVPHNWLFELVVVGTIFPAIIIFGSNAIPITSLSLCRLGGNLSYPAYILQGGFTVHAKAVPTHFGLTWLPAFGLILAMVAIYLILAWLALKLYDEPVRSWLQARGRVKMKTA